MESSSDICFDMIYWKKFWHYIWAYMGYVHTFEKLLAYSDAICLCRLLTKYVVICGCDNSWRILSDKYSGLFWHISCDTGRHLWNPFIIHLYLMHGLGSHSVISRKRRLRGREVRREENSLKTCIKSCITSLDTLSIPKLGNCVNLCGNMKKQTESGISQGARSWHRSCRVKIRHFGETCFWRFF